MQTKTITVQFKVKHNPGDDAHLEMVLKTYLQRKGVDYKDGVLTV